MTLSPGSHSFRMVDSWVQRAECPGRGSIPLSRRSSGPSGRPIFSVLASIMFVLLSLGTAQAQEHKKKVPGLDKITSGRTQQAFSGIVQSLDTQRNILNVNTVQGGATEIFPLKKGIHVTTADGEKTELKTLTPGTNVLIYYEQKRERRTVKQIVVLAGSPHAAKKSPPSS